ncbi:spore photoproduct lyase family protein [Anaeromassilibacillus sp. SJQ-5]
MRFDAVYYEPDSLHYPLGKQLKEQYGDLPWFPIENHNRIEEMQQQPNSRFAQLKRHLVVGVRKTHKYVENFKISDYLVPYTSSGCTAMCLYCYLVCHYNKCAYLRLFVNREQMLDRLIAASQKAPRPMTYEIGSNSDLVLENQVTGNLTWTIPAFAEKGRGFLTFPTKFADVGPLLGLRHEGKTIFRMSVNPQPVISHIELGTAPLEQRVEALNQMRRAGYPCGILIAPVILTDGWEAPYGELIEYLADTLEPETKRGLTVEIILMTYSYVHRAINSEAFPQAPDLYDKERMTVRGRGKYGYRNEERKRAEAFLRAQLADKLSEATIVYVC